MRAGFAVRLVNDSSLPHNVTIAKGAKVLAQTKISLRRFGDRHRGPGAGRVRLLLLGRRPPGRGDAGHAHRQVSGRSAVVAGTSSTAPTRIDFDGALGWNGRISSRPGPTTP